MYKEFFLRNMWILYVFWTDLVRGKNLAMFLNDLIS